MLVLSSPEMLVLVVVLKIRIIFCANDLELAVAREQLHHYRFVGGVDFKGPLFIHEQTSQWTQVQQRLLGQ